MNDFVSEVASRRTFAIISHPDAGKTTITEKLLREHKGEIVQRQFQQKRLSDAAIATLTAWADAGAPAGDPKDAPPPMTFRDGWNIRPDVVFEMPKPMAIPAKGTVEYTYIAVSAPFKEDTWVLAGEIRPRGAHQARVRSQSSGKCAECMCVVMGGLARTLHVKEHR